MNQTIDIFLLDDDPVFLQAFSRELVGYLQQRGEGFRLRTFQDGKELLEAAETAERLDLLISDICLGGDGISGLQVGEGIRSRFPACGIIYLTAFLEYATEIYDTRPLYFILKEEFRQRIPAAMELFFRDCREKQDSISFLSGRTRTVVRLRELIYCEHVGRKTRLVCTDRELLVPDSIYALAEKLPGRFIVCHKGYIVNLDYVESYRRFSVTLTTGQELPISRSRYETFQGAFADYLVN